jgi:hypothetical protein
LPMLSQGKISDQRIALRATPSFSRMAMLLLVRTSILYATSLS